MNKNSALMLMSVAASCSIAQAQDVESTQSAVNVSGYVAIGNETPGFIGTLSSYYCALATNLVRFGTVGGGDPKYTADQYRRLGETFILKMNEEEPFEPGEIEQMPLIMRQTAEAQMNIDLTQAESEGLWLTAALGRCELLYEIYWPANQ